MALINVIQYIPQRGPSHAGQTSRFPPKTYTLFNPVTFGGEWHAAGIPWASLHLLCNSIALATWYVYESIGLDRNCWVVCLELQKILTVQLCTFSMAMYINGHLNTCS